MENLKGNANYIYEEDKTEFNGKEANLVNEKIDGIAKKYRDAVKAIKDDGRLYLVELNKDYTAFGQTKRYARSIPEIGFIARIATEEKELGKGYEDYVKEFKENKIAFDGKTIPTFIDTIEKVQKEEAKRAEREAKKAEKAKEAKTEKPEKETK